MPSIIDYCNNAMDKLGQRPIMSLDDGNTNANLCKRNWPLVRDRVLRDFPWNFAIKRAQLAPALPAPLFGFSSRFQLPSDLLRVVEVVDMSTGDYQIEDGAILADALLLRVRYVYRVEDPNRYDSLFGDVVSIRLAYELCEKVTQSRGKKEDLWREYEDTLRRAKNTDAMENPPIQFEEDPWVVVRY